MRDAVQWLRSLIFVGQIYVMLPVIGLLYFPYALVSRKGATAGCKAYTRWVTWSAAWMVGLKTEVRGTPPTGEVIVAAKHQSFLDIMLIFTALPSAKFIMKREILRTPVIGLYAMRLGCIAVDRGKRSQAIKKMVADVARGTAHPGQLIIYPQGTRIKPGVQAPYKVGTAVLYEELGQDCVPVATNVGVFWPRKGIIRRPGTAVVEFLPVIEAGLDKAVFMARLENEVESASNDLMREAGFDPDGLR
ncbi:1-acyl-sn-glycerol-3-phosphate acyltransferase [Roseovarius sp. LXJ103]|uniref:lysophospholipid acyltransferase family protein n=1 Tax=Roseovarius carneus TaxID=2853164 RepID=UPI000D613F68|nr:lysophospholipid acyltransferase family protein [Roseovarius carneus]MBZ8118293.1 1-acyl-sn-glycerol-3-phosphate acyltransferase [Roseovarius carneus]PWE35985.1 1-acyl-sn-glycerol-3-phosphate acyltransferase [Pelagicola sp. LXJ1103]